MKCSNLVSAVCMVSLVAVTIPANASGVFTFSTGDPDGNMASATQPASAGKFEIESGDDFVLTSPTSITSATFTGLLTGNAASIGEVRVEIYRVFPLDSNTARIPNVPTRVNSPSDVEFADRSTANGNLSFSATNLGSFSVVNTVKPGGIHPMPGQTTGGNGPLTGTEVKFNVSFTTPFTLQPDHYFFVPQVEVTDPAGNFFWLSAPRPIVPPGTPFPLGFTDLQTWTRDQFLDPDWLRIGQDIVGGSPFPTFNASFSLEGDPATPLPSALPLFATGLGVLGLLGLRRKRKNAAAIAA